LTSKKDDVPIKYNFQATLWRVSTNHLSCDQEHGGRVWHGLATTLDGLPHTNVTPMHFHSNSLQLTNLPSIRYTLKYNQCFYTTRPAS